MNQQIQCDQALLHFFFAVCTGDKKGAGVMTRKTFMFARLMLMFVSFVLSLTLVFFLEVHV